MDFKSLEVFLAIYESGKLSAAAAALGISSSAVSQRLSQLETDLDVKLFERKGRRIHILPAASVLQNHALRVMRDLEVLKEDLLPYQQHTLPTLQLGLMGSLSGIFLPHLLEGLQTEIGRISISNTSAGPMGPDLMSGALDIIITSEPPPPSPASSVTSHMLINEPILFVAPKGMPPPTSASDVALLANHLPFVRLGPLWPGARAVEERFAKNGIEVGKWCIEINSPLPILELIRTGTYWTVMSPTALYATGSSCQELTVVYIPDLIAKRPISLQFLDHRVESVSARLAEKAKAILGESFYSWVQKCLPSIVGEIQFL